MKTELLRVMRVMSEVTHRMDLNEFARMVELNADEALQCIQDLTKTGYLKKAGGGYGITQKGKNILKAQWPVTDGFEFKFYLDLGQPTNSIARTLKEFYETVKLVDAKSLEFHIYRGDFENWANAVLKDEMLLRDFDGVRQSDLKGESLRRRMVSVIEKNYGIDALK